MRESEQHGAAMILLDCMIDFSAQLTSNGGPSVHSFASRIEKMCLKEQQRQLTLYDKAIAKEPK